MGDTKMTKYERKLRRKDWANRVLSVVLSFAMAMSSTPLPAGAVGEDDAAAAAQPTAAEVQAQQEQAATEASVSLNLSHAYLTVSGQTVGDVTKSLTVPITKDLAFTVAADSGYEVSEVYTSKDGAKTSLGTAAGNYTIPAASLADGLAVCVTTTELPQATQEETTATPLAEEDASSDKAEAADAKTSDAAEAESEAEATADQPATNQPAEEAAPTKTTYTYEDDQVSVTATLQDPAAVPDDAQFKVTPVTQGSTDYNYGAYMDALNQSAADDADKTYTSDNTLLYDVAFMVPKTDEAGNAIAGEWVEYEPTAGSVDIQISFKQSQLTDGIDAQSSDDVEVKHLPLTDAVRDATDSTADATNISASDVQVEDVQKADVSTEGEQSATITTDSLSVFAFTNGNTDQKKGTYWEGTGTISVGSVQEKLGLAGNIAVYADELDNQSGHIEGSIAVNTYTDNGSGNLNEAQRLITNNTTLRVTFTKSLTEAADTDQNFRLGIYTDEAATEEVGEVVITVPAGQTTGTAVVDSSSNSDLLSSLVNSNRYIYEIDDQGNPVTNGSYKAQDGSTKYTVSYANGNAIDGTVSSTLGNYIGHFNVSADGVEPNYLGAAGFNTYLGSDRVDTYFTNNDGGTNDPSNDPSMNNVRNVRIRDTSGNVTLNLRNYKNFTSTTTTYIHNLSSSEFESRTGLNANLGANGKFAQLSKDLAKAKRGATTGTENFSVINLVSTKGNLQDDMTEACFGSPQNGEAVKQLLQRDPSQDEYLLINIDATGKSTYTLTQMIIDGENADSDNGYPRIGSHVIFNFVQKDTSGNYVPYTGTVTIQNVTAGLIFAPCATVAQTGGVRGSIVANKVTRYGAAEIHQTGVSSTQSRYVTFGVTNAPVTSVKVTKAWQNAAGTTISWPEGATVTVALLDNGQETGKTATLGAGTTSYTFEGLPSGSGHSYTVKEVGLDQTKYEQVSITGDATVGYTITNKELSSAKAHIQVTKALSGRTWGSATFDFKLTAGSNDAGMGVTTPMPDGTSADGTKTATATADAPTVDFGEITYTHDGTYTYTVQEVEPANKIDGLTYDTAAHTVTVKVSNGNAVVDYGGGAASLTVTNTQAAKASLRVTKVLTGRDWKDGDSFTFTLAAGSNDAGVATPMPSATTATATKAAQTASFGDITYTKAGTYTYTITEAKGSAGGVSYDTTPHTVTVKVEMVNGVLTATPQYEAGKSSVEVTNTYTAEQTSVTFNGTKTVNGQAATGLQGKFTLTLTEVDANGNPVEGAQALTAVTANDGSFSFPTITYNAVGTHYYKFSEADIPAGYTKHFDDQTVKVEVTDDGNGHLSAATTLNGNAFTGFAADNTYSACGSATLQVTKQLTGRDWKDGDSFTFTLAAGSNDAGVATPMPSATTATATKAAQTASFGDITYTKAGTYTYTITEAKGSAGGVSYDMTPHTVTVVVTDDHAGHLTATPTYDGKPSLTVTNTYGTTDVSTNLKAQKRLNNAAPGKRTFDFQLTSDDNAKLPNETKATNDADGNVTFGTITYTHEDLSNGDGTYATEKTFTYHIGEVIPQGATDNKLAGVTYDPSTKDVTVILRDNGDGTLSVTKSGDDGSATFSNSYEASGQATISTTKSLTGKRLADGAFQFKLVAGDNDAGVTTPMPQSDTVTNSGSSVSFGTIDYQKAGTYHYTINEVLPNGVDAQHPTKDGITYDTNPVQVAVTVTDLGDGTLDTAVAYEGMKTGFANEYDASGSIDVTGVKTMEGRAFDASDSYTFTVSAVTTGAPLPVSPTVTLTGSQLSGTTASLPFGSITYHLDDLRGVQPDENGVRTKTFDYKVTEVGSGNGIKLDSDQTFSVTVTDHGTGALDVALASGSAQPSFKNTYGATGTATLTGTKVMSGRSFNASDKYTFTVTAADGAPMPTKNTITLDGSKLTGSQASLDFGSIFYQLSDLGGESSKTFEYIITETGQGDGVTLSQPQTVRVTVTDDGSGILSTSYDYGEGKTGLTFTNTYSASGDITITGGKAMDGRDFNANDQYAFTVTAVTAGAPLPENPTVSVDGSKLTGTTTDLGFGKISYNLSDLGGASSKTFEYQVAETRANGSESKGVALGSTETFSVTVTDQGNGHLEAKLAEGSAMPAFTNTYTATGTFTLGGSKHLDGRSFKQGDKWTFTVTGSEDAPMPAENSATIDPTAGNDQAFSFGDISYSLANAGHTYTYTITESGSGAGVTNDARTHTVEVSVADRGDGTLAVTPTYKVDGAAAGGLTFTNTYTAQKTGITIRGTKTLEGRDIADGEFQVALYAANDQFEITNQEPVATANVAAATASDGVATGTYALSVNTYVKTGTYRYVLKEVDTGKPGVAYDTNAYQVTVEVTDDHEGHLQAAVSGVPETGANFANTFTKASALLKARKTLTGGTLAEGQFTFELRDSTGVIATAKNDTTGNVQFPAQTYSEPGDYAYTINEQIPSDATNAKGETYQDAADKSGTWTKDGMTYDSSTHTVTVHVTKGSDNSLAVTYSYDLGTTLFPASNPPVAQFTNTYTVQATGFSVSGTKELTGANLTADQFTFTLKDNVGNPVGSTTNDANGSFTITTADDLIKRAGTYTYTLSEGDAASGITNDANASRTVTVKVSDDKHGNLVVDSVDVAGGTTFKNSYAATGSAHFEATKELTGADLKANQFSFTLSKDGTVLQTKKNDANGKVTFDDITYSMADLWNGTSYDQSRDFTYTIAEVNDHQGGVAYDGSTQTVVVHVTNNGDGTLGVSYDNSVNTTKVFRNTYSATGTASLSATKQLTGRALKVGEFTFALTAGTNDAGVATPMPEGAADGVKTATNNTDGLASFGDISYAKEGTYHYIISEVAGDEADMTYDPSSYDVTVNVADKGDGTMKVTYGADQQAVFTSPVFKNTHNAKGSATITAKKSLVGRALAAGEFSFQLRDAAGNLLQTATNAADGTVTFQPISYQLDDLKNADGTYAEAKDFTYTITEVDNGLPGVTYDTAIKTVTVLATLNKATGTIDTAVEGDGADATFSNTYTAQSTGFTVTGTKDLAGREIKDGEFSVALYATDAQGNLTGNALAAAPVAANGTYSLTTADNLLTAAGTYTYKVVEVRGSDTNITYDSTAKNVTVVVTDNTQTGKLEAVANEAAALPAFTNTYSAQGSISLKAHKTLTGRNLAAGQFTFQVTGSEGAPLPAGAVDGVATATNDAQGDVTFAGITFSQDDAGKSYTYTISEVDDGKAGYTYDDHSEQVVVNVADNGDGSLHITYGTSKVEDMPVAQFANTYQATGSTTVSGHKTVNGADRTDLDGKVTFTLTGTDGTNLTAKTDANGNFSFGDIAYDQDDAGKTYTYTLKETEAPNGYTKAADQTFTVAVTDNGDGTLTATKSTGDVGFTVNNQYAATGSATLSAHKQLTGASLAAGQFSFTLSEDGQPLQTKQNDSDGAVAFDAIGYSLADVGTHTYAIAEAIPEGATKNADGTYTLAGITYDGHSEQVVVNVADSGNGGLDVTYGSDKAAQAPVAQFTNTYQATGQALLSATKQLTGRTLRAGEFTFQLKDADGNVVQEKANDASGTVTFDPISYTAEGTYHYTISELAGTEADMTYDSSVKDVTVNVADKGDGTMVVTYGEGDAATQVFQAPTFGNTHNAKGSATIMAAKELTGRAQEAGEFSFQLSDASGKVLRTATNDANGTVTFNPISYQLADLGGAEAKDFTYTISEVNGGKAGVAYDTTSKQVTVHAALNKATGAIDTTVEGGGATATFANTYTASGKATLSATKTLNGAAPALGQFAFNLYGPDGELLQTVRNGANGAVSFADIPYTQADAGRSYTYMIVEAIPAGATKNDDGTYTLDGFTYDGHVEQVTVNVADKGDGTLAVTYGSDAATATSEAPVVTFANTYTAAATGFTVEGTKTLNGQAPAAGAYSFQLADASGTVVGTASNDADGSFSIATADDLIDAAGTYTYTLSEVVPEGATDNGDGTYTDAATGVTYDVHTATVTVTVADNGKGQLVPTVTTDQGASSFANTQKVSLTLGATKVLTGNQTLAGDDFAFEILRADGTQLTSARNAADGTVSFPAITYSIDDLKQDDGSYADSKTFTYTMREVVPGSATNAEGVLYADATDEQKTAGGFRTTSVSADGQPTYVTYDTTEHQVTVTLTCQDGVLTATTDEGYQAPTFTNYAFAASTSLTFDKHYYGSGSPTFSFTLQATDASWTPRAGSAIEADANAILLDDGEHALAATVENGAFTDGVATVSLPTIQYAKPGTYHYLLTEDGEEDDYVHDRTNFLITVAVGEDGTSSATYQARYDKDGDIQTADGLAFYNNAMVMAMGYRGLALAAMGVSTSGVTVQPLVKKVLVNGNDDVSTGNVSMEANAFKFRITDDQTGRVLETVGNASDGQVAFGKIYYTKEDLKTADGKYASEKTFTYTIDEVDTGDDSIVYDSGKITMSVTVSLVNDRVTVTKPTYSKSNAVEGIDSNVFVNRTKTVKVRNRKVSRDEQGNPTNEGLADGIYGLWMVGSNGSQDVYLGNKKSDADGYMVFDVPITEGNVYYFQEEHAPAGHLVDPYPSRKFELVKNESGKYEIHYLDN